MKYFACFLFLFAFSLSSKAQIGTDETVIPKSPNAAAFDKLDQVPVELATGGSNISFNLYNVKSKSINIPLELLYHSGGIKVDEIATWVGLGWSLDGGGLISRTINGNPDEGIFINKQRMYFLYSSTLGPINNFYGPWGYDTSLIAKNHFINLYTSINRDYGTITVGHENTDQMYALASQKNYWGGYSSSYLLNGLHTYPPLYEDIMVNNSNSNYPALPDNDNIYTSNLVDPQPDEFTLRIPGYAGKFSFNNFGVPQLNPVDKDLKISYVFNQNNNDTVVAPYIDTWMVSTTDGKQYYFGYNDTAKTRADGSTGSRSAYFFSPTIEWYLTKIVDVNTKDSVLFNYKQVRVATGRQLHEYIFPNNCTALGTTGGGIYESGETKASFPQSCTASILTKITTNKEIVNFYSATSSSQLSVEPSRLDSIVVTDLSTGTVADRINLTYDFFKMSKKLKLVSFQKQSLDQVNIQPPTTFNYYDTIVNNTIFPDRYTSQNDTIKYTPLAQDYWGYYNNATTNYNGFMVYPASCSVAVNRNAAWPYMQLEVLNKITYPTGGQTVFEYEPHTAETFFDEGNVLTNSPGDGYADNLFSLDTIGGLRVKKVTMIDSVGRISLIRQYTYEAGHLNITPSTTRRIDDQLCMNGTIQEGYILISNFNQTPFHQNSATVNYGKVTEKLLDSLGNTNGYTIYNFYNDANQTDTNFLSYTYLSSMSPYNPYAFNGLGNMPNWESVHSKGIDLLNGYEIARQVYSKDNKLLESHSNVYSVKQYPGFIGGFNFFAQDMRGPCNEFAQMPIDFYGNSTINPNMLYAPLAYFYYYIKYYAEYPKSVFLSQSRDVSYTTTGDSIVNTRQFYHESPNHLETTRTVNYNSKGDTLSSVNIYAFDLADNISGDTTSKQMKAAYFNPLIIASTFKGNQIKSSKVTVYKNFNTPASPAIYPVNIYLHRTNTLTTPLNTYGANDQVSYPVTTYFPDNNYTIEEAFNFAANGNLLERTKVNNFTTAYIWDYHSNLPIAEAIKAKAADIAYTSFEADGSGGWTINSTAWDSVTTPVTGRKSYILSNGSITKSSLTAAKSYRISYWTKNATAYSIAGTQSGYPVQGKTINGWTYFEHKITGQTAVTLSGSGSIDELRLYPDTAQMTTITYDPMVGTTSLCDVNNRVTYYEYDGLQRLHVIRDQDRNAVKKICYNYAGQPVGCSNNLYYNASLSQSFTKNNCGAGYIGTSITYTVPGGKYFASTVSAANQLAQNDMTANGQNYANTNGSCLFIYKNVINSQSFIKNDCNSLSTGSSVIYTVPANTYSSTIDQASADLQAENDQKANGQNYANAHGTCNSTIFDLIVDNFNYPNDAYSGITVTLKNNTTLKTYTTGSFKGPVIDTLINIPAGIYTVTYSGATYSSNTAIGIFLGPQDQGNQLYCASSTGTTQVIIDDVEFDAGQYYYFSQVSDCGIAAPAIKKK